jgi:hypothetical protein
MSLHLSLPAIARSYHAVTMANSIGAPLLVFSRMGGMPTLLSHYRPDRPILAFTGTMMVMMPDDDA